MQEREQRLFDGLDRVLEVAEKQQETSEKQQEAVRESISRLNKTTENLRGQIRREVDAAFDRSTKQVTADVNKVFEEANKYAKEAAETYREAAENFTWKFITTATIIGFIVLGLWTFLLIWFLPAPFDVAALRYERQRLETRVSTLEEAGALVQLRRCGEDERLCVKIDEEAPVYEGGHRILAEY